MLDFLQTESYKSRFGTYVDMIICPVIPLGQNNLPSVCANHIGHSYRLGNRVSTTPLLQHSSKPRVPSKANSNPAAGGASGLGFFTQTPFSSCRSHRVAGDLGVIRGLATRRRSVSDRLGQGQHLVVVVVRYNVRQRRHWLILSEQVSHKTTASPSTWNASNPIHVIRCV